MGDTVRIVKGAVMNPEHKVLFKNAKKAQNSIVEEKRLEYRLSQKPQTHDEWYDEAVPPDPLDILATPDLDAEIEARKDPMSPLTDILAETYIKAIGTSYTINPELGKSQRRQAERVLGKLESLLETGWVTLG